MRWLETLQHKTLLTRTETVAILTLSATFIAGLGIRWYQANQKREIAHQPKFDYSRSDSAYAARVGGPNQQTLSNAPTSLPSLPPAKTSRASGQKAIPLPNSINLNTATKSELMRLPGIGASYADRIIAHRSAHSAFTSIEDLTQVKGIGKKKLEKIRPFVRVH